MREMKRISVAEIERDLEQPRKQFDGQELFSLGQNLLALGQQVPVIVYCPEIAPDDKNAKRYRLAKILKVRDSLGLRHVVAVVVEGDMARCEYAMQALARIGSGAARKLAQLLGQTNNARVRTMILGTLIGITFTPGVPPIFTWLPRYYEELRGQKSLSTFKRFAEAFNSLFIASGLFLMSLGLAVIVTEHANAIQDQYRPQNVQYQQPEVSAVKNVPSNWRIHVIKSN